MWERNHARLQAARTEETDPRSAQRLMEGIFNLGYGTATPAEDLSWMEDALCAQTDPDIFYPEKGGSTAPATSICRNCPVRAECLDYAVTNDIRHGIWGGTSDNDRKRMSRERKARAAGQ
ncbi:WhiB family redox-sensing transcriptional regulator [Arcanobacterium wilhelmae]|uniref:Transcriptional regulator WhiB n=2 Tax=Arcanobacterium wilhelmae TaxID=1803177 RepID=A0ABT9NDA1_9ACTO|nr:WhiB family redox-sensing transcriptional regulator [Arcanobacterium wilhelmae]